MLQNVLKVTGRVKNKKTAAMLGYDYKQLQEHVRNHSNWNNLKNTSWHLDHIFPIKAFKDYGINDLTVINGLDNLQPLSQNINSSKNAKYNTTDFEQWLTKKGITWIS